MNHNAPTIRPAKPELPCLREDPELWFSERPEDVDQARYHCLGCSVRQDCLQGALDRHEPAGVWGGELFVRGVIGKARARTLRSAGLPMEPPAGVPVLTVDQLAERVGLSAKYTLELLRNARKARTAGNAEPGLLPEPIAGGSAPYPFVWAVADVTPWIDARTAVAA